MAEDIIKEEQQFVALLLNHPELVEDFQDSPLEMESFDATNRVIIHAIRDAHDNDVKLTRKSFLEFINKIISKKQEIARLEEAYNHISYATANRNDYPMLKERILNAFLLRQATQYVRDFGKQREEKSTQYAVKQLASSMTELANSLKGGGKNKIVYEDLTNFGKDYYKEMVDVRAGNVPDAEFISYGIEELDKTSGVGLAPGTMTLFCGDVGGFKSTMMMNVGLHVWWKEKYNVLYVPLEMPKKLVYFKQLSRQTQIPFDLINDPKSLSPEQMERLQKYMLEEAPANEAKIYLMDSYEQRTSVDLIRKMIERNLEVFKPRVVIVDYIANLTPDRKQDRADMDIGEMLKDLRYMGRPGVVHTEGFAIVSGAQIGREGLKRVRRSGNDKAMFYSEDLRGSHDYSADADTIYAQFPDPQQPDEKLQVFVVKSRYGKKTFPDGNRKATLDVKPGISMIRSANDYYGGVGKDEILAKSAVDDADLSFAPAAAGPTVSLDESVDAMFGTSSSGTSVSVDDFMAGV